MKLITPQYANDSVAAAVPLHKTLRGRATAALAAGCLALSLFPGIALAAPADDQASQQGGNPPAMQQGPGSMAFSDASFGDMAGGGMMPGGQMPDGQMPDGQAPDGQAPEGQAPTGQAPEGQAPDGQAPEGQAPDGQAPTGQAPEGQAPSGQAPTGQAPEGQAPAGAPNGNGPRSDALDDAVRTTLTKDYGVEASTPADAAAGQQQGAPGEAPEGTPTGQAPEGTSEGAPTGQAPEGAPGAAPELPEGAVNVQQIIDSVRDIFRSYSVSDLESADLTDESFAANLADYVLKAAEERLQMFASGEKPSDMQPPAGEAPTGQASEGQAPTGEAPTGEAPTGQSPAALGKDASEALIANLTAFVMGVFGYTA